MADFSGGTLSSDDAGALRAAEGARCREALSLPRAAARSIRGFALASASTLNRLELSAQFEDYYRKVHPDAPAVGAALWKMGVRCLSKDAEV